MRNIACIAAAIVLLAGNTAPVAAQENLARANGIYAAGAFGSDAELGSEDSGDAGLAILYDGRILGLHIHGASLTVSLYTGTVAAEGDALSGLVRGIEFEFLEVLESIFNLEPDSDETDYAFENRSVSGRFVEHESLQFTFTQPDGEEMRLSYRYEEVHDRASSLSLWEGTWVVSDEGVQIASLTVHADGSFFGQDADGCTATGSLSILDANRNLYGLDTTVELCGEEDGRYTGFAYLDPLGGSENEHALLFASTEDGQRIWGETYSRPGAVVPPTTDPTPTEDDHGNDRDSATRIRIGAATVGVDVPGVLTAGDVDYFRIDASGSGTLEVYTTGGIDTLGQLEDAGGSPVDNDDDGGADLNFRISADVSDVTHYVRVSGFSDADTGSYTLHVRFAGSTSGETTYGTGDTLADLPTGSWVPDAVSSGQVIIGDAGTSIRLDNEGYVERGGFRYTCRAAGGCEIGNRQVVSGTVVRTSVAAVSEDTQPSFAGARGPGNPIYTVGTAIDSLTLPVASGGDGALTYSLMPEVPGLTFDASTRRLTGTPTQAGMWAMTYTVRDADGDAARLGFSITVEELDAKAEGFELFPADEFSTHPTGITHANGRFHVVDYQDDKVYAYTASWQRDAATDFDLHPDNSAPRGIVYANGRFYITDGDGKVYAYTASGQRNAAAEFELHADNSVPSDIAYANSRFHVVDLVDRTVYAYTASGRRDAAADFDLHFERNTDPFGIAYANSRFHIVSLGEDKVYAYSASGQRDAAADFDLFPFPENDDASGIAFANDRFYVIGRLMDKVYAYTASGQRDAAVDFDLNVDINTSPGGIAYGIGRFHIVDVGEAKVFAYAAPGQRDPAADFFLHPDNSRPDGIAYANGRFHVVDFLDLKVYVYSAAGQRNEEAEFDLHADNTRPFGITYANGRFHVVDYLDRKVYAYTASGQRDAAADFGLHNENRWPQGIAYANGRFHVVDSEVGWVFTYAGPEDMDDGTDVGPGGPDDHGDDRDSATRIRIGAATVGVDVPGALTAGDVDYFRIDANGSGTLEVYTTGVIDTVGQLEDAGGSPVASDDGGGADFNFRISAEVSDATHYVRVSGFSDAETGSYTLHVRFTASNSGETTYGTGDTLDDLPTGSWVPDAISGGQIIIGDAGTSIRLDNEGYVEQGGFRYTCRAAGGCEIGNRQVVSGMIVRTSAGAMPADTQPTFAGASEPGTPSYTAGTAIDTVTLAEASGGDGTLTYSLAPEVPGLTFDPATRQLTGTPTAAGTYDMTYTVTDADGDSASLGFTVTVNPSSAGTAPGAECYVGLLVGIGERCTCPGTTDAFSVNVRGRGSFLGRLAGIRIRIDNETIDGRVYDFAASHQGEGVWRIDRIAGSTEAPETPPGTGGGEAQGFDLYRAGIGPDPSRIVYANGRFYILDSDGAKLYAYLPSGERDEAADFDLHANSGDTLGITFANGRFYLVDLSTDTVIAYLTSGQRDRTAEFDREPPAGNPWPPAPLGIAYASGRFHIVYESGEVQGYTASGQRDAAADFDLHPDNSAPDGIEYANDRYYVVDGDANRVYAYTASGQRDAAAEFELYADNGYPGGIAYANGWFHVVDRLDDSVYAYTAVGQRDATVEFDLNVDANTRPVGIAYANARFRVVDRGKGKVYAYSASGQHDASAQFDLHGENSQPWGIAYADGRFHVVDQFEDKVYAYTASGQRDQAADFDLHPDNSEPWGIAWADGRFHVVDLDAGRVYAYLASGQRDTSTEFNLHPENAFPSGIVFADGRFHVVDLDAERVYTYSASGQRDTSAEIDLHVENYGPSGIAYADGRFHVVDLSVGRVFAYDDTGDMGDGTEVRQGDSDDHGDDGASATRVRTASDTPGVLTAGDVDYFRIDASGSGALEVYTTGDINTTGRLEDADGSTLASDDDGGAVSNFRIRTGITGGTHYVRVSGFSGAVTGSYTLHVRFAGWAAGSSSHSAGGTLFDLPTGIWTPDRILDGSFSLTGDVATAELGDGGYVEQGVFRYTCRNAGGCTIRNRVVVSGRIIRESTGAMLPVTQPSFGNGSEPGSPTYSVGTTIAALTLPAANNGDGTLTYSVAPEVPGLSFDSATRRFTGTPSETGLYQVTYTATDADGDTDSLRFIIAVMPGDQHYTVGTPIDALSLPAIIGGEEVQRVYSLFSPLGQVPVPGLNYNKATRRLSGTPSEAGTYAMRYLVQSDFSRSLIRNFTINVTEAPYSPEILVDADSSPMVFNDNLFVLPVAENISQDEDGSTRNYAIRQFFEHFEDEFDFLFVISNIEQTPPRPYTLSRVRNDALGIGQSSYDSSRLWGSDGYLTAVVDLPRYASMTNGPSLHEVLHTWANFVVDGGYGGHWGFTSANGVIGGFDARDLIDLGDGHYTAGPFFSLAGFGGNSKPFSPIELYLAGFIPADDVPDLLVAENPEWLLDENGDRVSHLIGGYFGSGIADPVFTADGISRLSIEDIIADAGERSPPYSEAQKDFRAAAILLIDAQHPASRTRLEFVSETVSWFSHPASDEFDDSFNFHEATGGRGTMAMDELSRFKKDSSNITATFSQATLSDLPADPWTPDATSGGSISVDGDVTTFQLVKGGYIEEGNFRYTCLSAGGCTIRSQDVVKGTIVRTSTGVMSIDTQPSFSSGSGPGNPTLSVGTAIAALTLPVATGGDGTLTYSLMPQVPGLRFDGSTRQLAGTPTTAGTYELTYTATDADGDTARLGFRVTVNPDPSAPVTIADCYVGLMVGIGESCRYPGTTDAFSVNVRGRGSFLGRLAGIRIRIDNETIDGRVYDFQASHRGDGVWRIDRIAGSTEPPGTSPRFPAGAGPDNQTYTVGTAIHPLTLPAATGGDGTLTYSLSPEVPGLSFDSTTRRMTGTPSAAGTHNMTYRVRDTDGDTDTLTFAITVNPASSSEPRTVQLFYVLPSDRPFRQEVVDAIRVTIRHAQTFFSEQLRAHGHPNMTFRVETDGNGEPLVHRVDLEHPDNHYADGAPVDADLPATGILFMVHDVSYWSASGGRNNKNRGGATVTAETVLDASTSLLAGEDTSLSLIVVLHELGHAFGLPHDWRDGAYIMSYGGGAAARDRLSACAADFLSIHPYFNANVPIEETSPATVGLVSSPAYPTGATSVPVQLEVIDPDGLHQVILLSQGGLKACQGMNGEEDVLVEFDYDGYISPATDPNRVGTSLSNPPVHTMEVMAVDAAGDVGELAFDLFDISTQGNLIGVLEGLGSEVRERFSRRVTSLAFSHDGTVLASAAKNDNIKLWNVAARTTFATLPSPDEILAFSPDGLLLASGGFDGTVRLWDVAARRIVASLQGHTSPFQGAAPAVHAVEFSPDGSILASGGADRTVKLWDVAARTEIASLEGHSEWVADVAFSHDGATLASGSMGIKLWDVAAGTELDTFSEGRSAVAFSPEGKTLAYREGFNEITLRDTVTWNKLTTLEGHKDTVLTLTFSPNGAVLASGSYDATVRLWDVAAQSEITTLFGSGEVESVAFSPDGTILATGSGDGDIRLWDMSLYVTPVHDNGDESTSASLGMGAPANPSMMLVEGGELGIFTPFFLIQARCPADLTKELPDGPATRFRTLTLHPKYLFRCDR